MAGGAAPIAVLHRTVIPILRPIIAKAPGTPSASSGRTQEEIERDVYQDHVEKSEAGRIASRLPKDVARDLQGNPTRTNVNPPLAPKQGTLFQHHRTGRTLTARERARVDRPRGSASAKTRKQRHIVQTRGAGRAISLISNSLKRLAQINGDDADTEPHNRYVAFSKFGLFLFWDGEAERWACPVGYNHQFEDVTGWDPQRLLMSGYGQSTYGDFEPLESWM